MSEEINSSHAIEDKQLENVHAVTDVNSEPEIPVNDSSNEADILANDSNADADISAKDSTDEEAIPFNAANSEAEVSANNSSNEADIPANDSSNEADIPADNSNNEEAIPFNVSDSVVVVSSNDSSNEADVPTNGVNNEEAIAFTYSNDDNEQISVGDVEEPKLPELSHPDLAVEEAQQPFDNDESLYADNSNGEPDVRETNKDASLNESEYEEDVEPGKDLEPNEIVNENNSFIDSQLEFLINNAQLLKSKEFLNANFNTKIYLVSKILSKNDALKIPSVTFKVNERRKRDYSLTQDSNGTNPFDKNVTSEELSKVYEEYLQEEGSSNREFYPRNSRLFIANLPLTNVTKKNLFQIFYIYGKILQINIKNNFGFIQYDSADSVLDAIKFESKRENFGRKLVLEISNSTARPQYDHGDHGKNTSSTFVSSYKRYKNGELVKPRENYSNGNEKSIRIIVKHHSDRNVANNLFEYLSKNRGWLISMSFLKPQEELKHAIKNAAGEQSTGCVIIKNSQSMDAIVFSKKPNGETTLNEYSNADRRDLIRLFSGGNSGYKNNSKQQFPGMVTPNIQPIQGFSPNMPNIMPQPPYMQQPPPGINLGYPQSLPPQPMHMQQAPHQGLPPQDTSRAQQQNMGLDQNALLSQVQNLPPDVLKNLLANAQQQQVSSNRPSSPQAPTNNSNKDVLQLLNNLTKK